MLSEHASDSRTTIQDTREAFVEALHIASPTLPIVVSFSASFSLRIQKTSHNLSSVVAEVVLKNGVPLQIRPLYKALFLQ